MSSRHSASQTFRVAGGASNVYSGRAVTSQRSTPSNRRYTTHSYGHSIVINGDCYGPPLPGLHPDMSSLQASILSRRPSNVHPPTYPTPVHAGIGEHKDFQEKWDIFRPYFIDLAGVQADPWEIDTGIFFDAWAALWGSDDAQTHRTRINIFAPRELDVWRGDLAQYALEYLRLSWDEVTGTQDARRRWVADMLSAPTDKPDNLSLYYKKIRGSGSDLRRTGMFQSPIIASTLGLHLLLVSKIPIEERIPVFPQAALTLAIHSATRAAQMWANGERPADPHAGYNAIPGNREFLVQKVARILSSGDGKVQDIFNAAMQEIQVAPSHA